MNIKHCSSWNKELTVNASEGDAKEQTINKSTPHSANGQLHEAITKNLGKQGHRNSKYTVIVNSEQISENIRNVGITTDDNDSDLTKDSKENVAIVSAEISKYNTYTNLSFICEEARLGTTARSLPRQAENYFQKKMKISPGRSTLGSTTTRLSPRRVVGCSNRDVCNNKLP